MSDETTEMSLSSDPRRPLFASDLSEMYRDRLKGVQILLNNSQAEPGRKVKQQQEEISRNHVQAF